LAQSNNNFWGLSDKKRFLWRNCYDFEKWAGLCQYSQIFGPEA
jgi:hypothetical protein